MAKVVVTGMGTVNPIGSSVKESWSSLMEGKSGIDRISAFDPKEYQLKTEIAGEVTEFDPERWMDRKEARRMDRFSQLALAAAVEAMGQADLALSDDQRYGVGCIVGSGVGGISTIVEQSFNLRDKGIRRVSPFTVPMLMPNAASGVVSMHLGLWGPTFSTASACASSTDAIGVAFEAVRKGRVKAMLAGGSEAVIIPICVASFEQAQALTSSHNHEPQKASRPFDRDRDGFVLSEGAAMLVLEDEAHARARGANILGEIAGYGAAADAYHITAPEPSGRGATEAMRAALKDAEVGISEVAYINAHGTSTQLNDKVETLAIHKVFGEVARSIPVSSTKSTTGHLAGAAGALEAIISIKVIQTGWAPPTMNYDNPDPECDLDYIPGTPRELRPGLVISNSFGFGGHSSCLAFRRYNN